MRPSLLLAIALLALPGVAKAQYYGSTPGYGSGYGSGYGGNQGFYPQTGYASPGGYGQTGYGGVPSYGNGGSYGQYGYGQSGAYGAPYQQPNNGGFYGQAPTYGGQYQPRTPDDVMTQGRVRTDGSKGGPSVALPGQAPAPSVQERKNPRGQRFEGLAKVIDGNTIVLGSDVLVLDGADAPEVSQTCTEPSGLEWQCGRRARDRLIQIADGRKVVCTGIGFAGQGIAARCSIGMTDIGKEMVAEGWALSPKAVSTAYITDEALAKADKRGVWAGTVVSPWTYRAKN